MKIFNFTQNEILERTVLLKKYVLTEVVKKANVQYTLPPECTKGIDLALWFKNVFDDTGNAKFTVGIKRTDNRVLQLCLPKHSTVRDFVKFMIDKKDAIGFDSKMTSSSLSHFLKTTATFCDRVLCSKDHKLITECTRLLFVYFHQDIYFNNNVLGFTGGKKLLDLKNEFIRRCVLMDGWSLHQQLESLVYIPNDKTIEELIEECSTQVKTESEFLQKVIDSCEDKQTKDNRKVQWISIISEMKEYAHFPGNIPEFQLVSSNAPNKIKLDKCDFSALSKGFWKLSIEFDIIDPKPINNTKEILINYLIAVASICRNNGVAFSSNPIDAFTEIVSYSHEEEYACFYNLQNHLKELTIIEIKMEEFNRIVEEEARSSKFSLKRHSFVEPSDGIAIFVDGFPIVISNFPYIKDGPFNIIQLLINYAEFVKGFTDSRQNRSEVMDDFYKKFFKKEMLKEYKKFLEKSIRGEIYDPTEFKIGNQAIISSMKKIAEKSTPVGLKGLTLESGNVKKKEITSLELSKKDSQLKKSSTVGSEKEASCLDGLVNDSKLQKSSIVENAKTSNCKEDEAKVQPTQIASEELKIIEESSPLIELISESPPLIELINESSPLIELIEKDLDEDDLIITHNESLNTKHFEDFTKYHEEPRFCYEGLTQKESMPWALLVIGSGAFIVVCFVIFWYSTYRRGGNEWKKSNQRISQLKQ